MVKDECIVLNRFLLNNKTLLSKCYFSILGRKDILVPNYFSNFKIGTFEPFNIVKLYLVQRNNSLVANDILELSFVSRKASKDFEKFFYLSKIVKVILNFIREGDEEIFQLIRLAFAINKFYSFNYLRFLLNLLHILGFSIENLTKPGWINLTSLSSCKKREINNPYCIFLSPKEFAIIKRVLCNKTRPFKIEKKIEKSLDRFFYKFLEIHKNEF